MIHRTLREPNYVWKGTNYKGDIDGWITYAASEAELKARLEAKEYSNIEIKDYDFQQWKNRAAEATDAAVAVISGGGTSGDIAFNRDIWGQLKHHLFECFDGKCAYCESKVLHVASGDVEHYRPKRKVEEEPSHPGYYWLAYDIGNLLPSCEKCNRARGKETHFKIAGTYACSPGDSLDDEKPLMLHACKDDPTEYLAFVPGFFDQGGMLRFVGRVEGIGEVGEKTVEICNLMRPELVEERRAQQESFYSTLLQKLFGPMGELVTFWCDVLLGKYPYSASILAQMERLGEKGLGCPEAAAEMATQILSAGAVSSPTHAAEPSPASGSPGEP